MQSRLSNFYIVELTLTHANHDDNTIPLLREVNEKLVANSFMNGLKNSELRIIVKRRKYERLKDAKKEELVKSATTVSDMCHIRGRYPSSKMLIAVILEAGQREVFTIIIIIIIAIGDQIT